MVVETSLRGDESEIRAELWLTHRFGDCHPVGIVAHRDRDPLIFGGCGVDTLRIRAVAVAFPGLHSARQGVFDDGFGSHRGTGFDLGHFDQLAFARSSAMFEGG